MFINNIGEKPKSIGLNDFICVLSCPTYLLHKCEDGKTKCFNLHLNFLVLLLQFFNLVWNLMIITTSS
jgi:hypothetical protein